MELHAFKKLYTATALASFEPFGLYFFLSHSCSGFCCCCCIECVEDNMMEHAVTRSLQTSHDSCISFWCHNVVAVSLLYLTWRGYPCAKLSKTVIYSELAHPSGFHAIGVLRHRCTVVLIAGRALLLLLKAVHRVGPLGTRGTNPRWYFAVPDFTLLPLPSDFSGF